MSKNVGQQLGEDLKTSIEKETFNVLTKVAVPDIIEAIENEYTQALSNVPISKNSLCRPEAYFSLFKDRLNKHEFVEIADGKIKLSIPDVENFDFSGDLSIIHVEIEGMAPRTYLEVTEEERRKMNFDKSDLSLRLQNTTVYFYDTKRFPALENHLKKYKIERKEYPFSKVGPIDIFKPAEEMANKMLEKWLDIAVKKSQSDFAKKYEGKTL
jgi:hypothetical protein